MYTEYVFLCMATDIMFSNFINNTVEYQTGAIYACQNNNPDVYCGVSGCSFINNSAAFVCSGIDIGMFYMTDCYVDEGRTKNGLWTNMVFSEQLILQTQFATRGICQTNPALATYTMPVYIHTPTPSQDLSVGDTTVAGETIKITTITATCVAGIGSCGTIIWAVKKILKKIIKKGIKKALFDSSEEEEEEEYTYEKTESDQDDQENQPVASDVAKEGHGSHITSNLTSSNSVAFKASDERDSGTLSSPLVQNDNMTSTDRKSQETTTNEVTPPKPPPAPFNPAPVPQPAPKLELQMQNKEPEPIIPESGTPKEDSETPDISIDEYDYYTDESYYSSSSNTSKN